MKKQPKVGPKILAPLLVLASLGVAVTGCNGPNSRLTTEHSKIISNKSSNVYPVSKTGLYFDTVITVTLYEYTGSSDDIFKETFEICDTYEKMLSSTVEGSDIWNINHSGGSPTTVSPDTAKLLERALYYCELSNGKLDITLGDISKQWNFSENAGLDSPILPSDEVINELLKAANYHNITIDGQEVTLSNPETSIELGFIAKGYIADRLYDYLKNIGVTSAIINLGGNVKVVGSKPDGTAFKIGIQKPFADMGETFTVVDISDSSVVSSGVYERYFNYDGKLYHHILDPKTGYPYETDILSASIKTNSSTDADALSTLCFILGPDAGIELIESLENTEVMYITNNYEMFVSSGW